MTWQVGDLAVCVDARKSRVVKGAIYTVSAYFYNPAFNELGGYSEYTLCFLEIAPPQDRTGFCESRFRKIVSDKAEQCEPEFVTLLKRIKRKQTVPASGDEQ